MSSSELTVRKPPIGAETASWFRHDYGRPELLVLDAWNHAGFVENAFYTQPFKEVLLAERFTEVKTVAPQNPTHTFRVKAPLLVHGQTICLLGDGPALGHWNTQSPVLLGRVTRRKIIFPCSSICAASLSRSPTNTACSMSQKQAFVRFEDGANRILADTVAPDKHTRRQRRLCSRCPRAPGAARAWPFLFSVCAAKTVLASANLPDLKLLADWGKRAGLKLIQLLPINDTSATHTWKDSYPYAAISAFALHPIYLNLAAVANAKNKKLLEAWSRNASGSTRSKPWITRR